MLAARAHTTKRDAVLAQAIAVAPGGGLQGSLEFWCGHILARATHCTGNMVVVRLKGLCQADIRCPAAHMHGGNGGGLVAGGAAVARSAMWARLSGLSACCSTRRTARRGVVMLYPWWRRCWVMGVVVTAILALIVAHGPLCCNNRQFCNIFAKVGRGEYNLPI